MTVRINPAQIPTVAAGNLFSRLTSTDADDQLSVRYVVATDPVAFFTYNRVFADIVVRQLVLAKAIDATGNALNHLTVFPFIITPQVGSGSEVVELPQAWIWDIHASVPAKWENLRLAKILRISGENAEGTDGITYTGKLRLIFTANQQSTTDEKALFYADYDIASQLTYQLVRIRPVTTAIDDDALDTLDASTIGGFLEFKTLDLTDALVQSFLDLIAPPTDVTDVTGDGLFDSPAVYEIVDSTAGGSSASEDFALASVSHGSGFLTASAWNAIPEADTDIQSWVESTNYPFDSTATRTASNLVVLPNGLFREFAITAPAGDEPTGDSSGLTFPVYISRIEALGDGQETLRVYFATHNITDTGPSTDVIEFATLDLPSDGATNDIIAITPLTDLLGTEEALDTQHFGRGHVVLSSKWDDDPAAISDFFESFSSIIVSPRNITFSVGGTRISSFGVNRVPKYVPTKGQSQALTGTTGAPSSTNRYVTEADQGEGEQIDLEALTGITPHAALARYGYTGSLSHRIIKLELDGSSESTTDDFYTTHVLPRLTALLGRAPQFGDFWYDGTRLKFYGTDAWQTP